MVIFIIFRMYLICSSSSEFKSLLQIRFISIAKTFMYLRIYLFILLLILQLCMANLCFLWIIALYFVVKYVPLK